jgi:adenylate kinase
MAMAAINDLFSRFGVPARTKLLILGPADSLADTMMDRVRSLNLEHVSSAGMMRREISRRRAPGAADEAATALLRRWFFTRKPDAGFILTDFPATLLQAMVFDEWLDARDEALNAVLAGRAPQALAPVVEHYRTLGLLFEEAGNPRAA